MGFHTSTPLPVLREQILALIKINPFISKKKMAEILNISMYALKKELADMNMRKLRNLRDSAGMGSGSFTSVKTI